MNNYTEAFQGYKDALDHDPKDPDLLYNAGLMAYLSENANEAVTYWSRLKTLEPDDWQLQTKLIQAYEAAERPKERDAERADLFRRRKETNDQELKTLPFYCRDQFSVGTTRIMVFEYFKLVGDAAIRLSFELLDSEGKPLQSRYTLGSYKRANDIAKEFKQIQPDQRLFHLDAYLQGGEVHHCYGFFVGEPEYDIVKAIVKEVLPGKRNPLSASSRKGPGFVGEEATSLGVKGNSP